MFSGRLVINIGANLVNARLAKNTSLTPNKFRI